MDSDGKPLASVIIKSVKELQEQLDRHSCLLAAIMEGQKDLNNLPPQSCCCSSRQREQKLRQVIQEAIDVLEQSRRAFKSRQLELLRKKLTQVLIDN